jgi:hypothetical protein
MTAKKQRKQTAPVDIRQKILSALKRRKRTPHWLSRAQRTVHEATARQWLYGIRRSIRTEAIGEMMAIMGLELKPIRGFKIRSYDNAE